MSFLLPQALVTLLLIPLLGGVYIWLQRRRRRYALRYASVSLVRDAVGRGPAVRRHIPPALFLLALAAMAVALARPQVTLSTPRDTGIVMLSVDVSGSMQATDVSPSRMEATKDAVRSFVRQQPAGVEVGLVAFNASASVLQAPTFDKSQVLRAVDELEPGGGTNIGDGLQVALDAIRQTAKLAPPLDLVPASATTSAQQNGAQSLAGTIVLLSDGESNTGPPPLQVAQDAASEGVKVDTVGIGTAAGTVLNIQGQSILTRLDESTLQGMADATGGRYLNAQSESQLTQVYSDLGHEQLTQQKPVEVTFIAAAAALLLMLMGGILSLLWFNRLP